MDDFCVLSTFVQKRKFMMTREEILSIEEYCADLVNEDNIKE